jgi:AcrR family transcriptional regulator
MTMRVTAQVKAKTRQRILKVARKLFADKGFHATSTRDLASAAAVAAGTVFNYFPTKEDLAMTLMAEALDEAAAEFSQRRRGEESLAEDLFAHVACGLRALRPFRAYAGEVFETALSPFGVSPAARVGDDVRSAHLETVGAIIARHGGSEEGGGELVSALQLQLYWSLYLAVLASWTRDESPHQEDSLVMLDHSMRLFADAVEAAAPARDSEEPS